MTLVLRNQSNTADGIGLRGTSRLRHVGRHRDGRPGGDDDDAGEGKVPVALREPREVRSSSMQTPHDPEVTYTADTRGRGTRCRCLRRAKRETPCR